MSQAEAEAGTKAGVAVDAGMSYAEAEAESEAVGTKSHRPMRSAARVIASHRERAEVQPATSRGLEKVALGAQGH